MTVYHNIMFLGTYAVEGSSVCTKCTAGKACANTTVSTSVDCVTGEYSFAGSGECITCPAGWECPSTDGSQNARCVSGRYSTGGQTDCTDCPSGKKNTSCLFLCLLLLLFIV